MSNDNTVYTGCVSEIQRTLLNNVLKRWNDYDYPKTYTMHPTFTNYDGMKFEAAFEKIKEAVNKIGKNIEQDQPKEKENTMNEQVKYVHLRRFNNNGKMLKRGGITLAYEQHGEWMKIGCSFCCTKDKYQKDGVGEDGKPFGKRLALARLWTNPVWIHVELFYDFGVMAYTTCEGRAWIANALDKGMFETWDVFPMYHKTVCTEGDDTCDLNYNGYCCYFTD